MRIWKRKTRDTLLADFMQWADVHQRIARFTTIQKCLTLNVAGEKNVPLVCNAGLDIHRQIDAVSQQEFQSKDLLSFPTVHLEFMVVTLRNLHVFLEKNPLHSLPKTIPTSSAA
mmetsp:Transcript_8097/g.30048  ORF Transcript_8097/g.30048 Transcript_8097/m.30048 type:complete len:114 (+) Transcript_8097:465-806(+)